MCNGLLREYITALNPKKNIDELTKFEYIIFRRMHL